MITNPPFFKKGVSWVKGVLNFVGRRKTPGWLAGSLGGIALVAVLLLTLHNRSQLLVADHCSNACKTLLGCLEIRDPQVMLLLCAQLCQRINPRLHSSLRCNLVCLGK